MGSPPLPLLWKPFVCPQGQPGHYLVIIYILEQKKWKQWLSIFPTSSAVRHWPGLINLKTAATMTVVDGVIRSNCCHLIPKEDPHNILRSMLINVPQPICHTVEAFWVCDVVDQHDTHGLPEGKRTIKSLFGHCLNFFTPNQILIGQGGPFSWPMI